MQLIYFQVFEILLTDPMSDRKALFRIKTQ
jgi:hypothetical protein